MVALGDDEELVFFFNRMHTMQAILKVLAYTQIKCLWWNQNKLQDLKQTARSKTNCTYYKLVMLCFLKCLLSKHLSFQAFSLHKKIWTALLEISAEKQLILGLKLSRKLHILSTKATQKHALPFSLLWVKNVTYTKEEI